MAILDIVYYGDPRLEKLSEPVNEVMPETRRFVKDMFETMYFTSGVGLSAPQVGVNQRILVIDCSGGADRDQQIVLINPVVISSSGEQKGPEGCLSFPGLFAEVSRPNIVKVKGLNLDGKELEIEGEGLLARALHHEIDHLDGVLFIQRMKKADREMIVKKMKKQKFEKPPKDKVLV
ncbi:peptide deformylase [bacterium]|nr:peptide deformylase [bacterium]MCI0602469.1 peptide deformylase [bacterium]